MICQNEKEDKKEIVPNKISPDEEKKAEDPNIEETSNSKKKAKKRK
jgi:hypothetical protein